MIRCANGQAPPRRLVPCRSTHREDQNVRLTPKSSPAQRRNYRRLIQQPTSPRKFVPYLRERTIGWGVTFGGKDLKAQCPNEPNIIVAMSSTETRKGEVGVSKFIPTHLICPFFDEPLFA
jgi:hypothetical protein